MLVAFRTTVTSSLSPAHPSGAVNVTLPSEPAPVVPPPREVAAIILIPPVTAETLYTNQPEAMDPTFETSLILV